MDSNKPKIFHKSQSSGFGRFGLIWHKSEISDKLNKNWKHKVLEVIPINCSFRDVQLMSADISSAIVLLKYGTSCQLIPTSAVLTRLHVHLSALTFLINASSHYILFLCNFMALRKRLICSAIANEPTTDMLFLSSTSCFYTLSVSCTINEWIIINSFLNKLITLIEIIRNSVCK